MYLTASNCSKSRKKRNKMRNPWDGNKMENAQLIEVFGNVDPAVLSGQALEQACVWLAENDVHGGVYFVFNEEYQRRANWLLE